MTLLLQGFCPCLWPKQHGTFARCVVPDRHLQWLFTTVCRFSCWTGPCNMIRGTI